MATILSLIEELHENLRLRHGEVLQDEVVKGLLEEIERRAGGRKSYIELHIHNIDLG